MNVRIRGIYTTALTAAALRADHTVVDASAPIQQRFDADFPTTPPDVQLSTTEDRQGVGVSGDPDAVETARGLVSDIGRDTFIWDDPTPPRSILDGTVTETLSGGALVALSTETDAVEGYLPYGSIDGHVETGDSVRVQVRESAAPWRDQRPALAGQLRVETGMVRLEPGTGTRVDVRDDEAGRELAGMVDLLGLDPPDGWRAVWKQPAIDAETGVLEAELQRATAAAEALTATTATGDDGIGVLPETAAARSEPIAAPTAGFWAWFGRESRFALDEIRGAVTTTMPGHHRIKAGAAAASAGVDFAEALCDPDPDAAFPFAVVTETFGPTKGGSVRLDHGKPDGRCLTLGEGTVTDADTDGTVTVERELTGGGTYDGLGVEREAGDVAVTSIKEGRWWYPTTYRGRDGTLRGTYVNVCTPVEVFPDAVRYVDLHVDVIKHADGRVEIVDERELDRSVAAGHTPEPLAEKARSVASAVKRAL